MTDLPVPMPAPVARERVAGPAAVRPPAWFPAAALTAGAGAATLVADQPPGLGMVLELVLIASVLLAAVRRELSSYQWLLVAAGAPLAMMPAVTDADWLIGLDVLAVSALGCLTLVGVDGWASILRAGLSVFVRVFTAPAFLLRGIAPAFAGRTAPVMRGAITTLLLLLVFGALLGNADSVFGRVVSAVLPDVAAVPERLVVVVLVTCLTAACLAAHLAPLDVRSPASRATARSRIEWALPMGALVALFVAFVAVQFTVLFAGRDHVVRTAGLTFAEYARSGFGQLLVVVALVLGVAAICVRTVAPADARDRRLMQVLLGALGVLTLVVLASAVRRLGLYVDEFGLSHARVLAATIAAWFAVTLVANLVAVARWSAAWLPRLIVVATAGVLIALNLAGPDARIAASQVERFRRTGELDVYYVAGLGAEAVPALVTLPAAERECVLAGLRERLAADDGWRGANLARARARSLLRATPASSSATPYCGEPGIE